MPNRKMVTEELRLLRDFLLREERKAFKENNNRAINVLMHYRNIVIDALALLKEQPELIRCKDCKYHFVDGDNVRFNMCLLSHNKVQPDDWFCADGIPKEVK